MRWIETLESRQFLSIGHDVLPSEAPQEGILMTTAAPAGVRIPNVVGKYRGDVTVNGGQKVRVNLTISRQTPDGKIRGSLSSPLVGSARFSARGSIKPDGKFNLKFGNEDVGVTGSIKGTRNARNGGLKGTFQVMVAASPPLFFQGNFSLKKLS